MLDVECEGCEVNDAKVQTCEADGRLHHHGMVHVKDKGLMYLCDSCSEKLNPRRLPKIVPAADGESYDVYI